MTLRRSLYALIFCATIFAVEAPKFWDARPPSEWSTEEIQLLRSKSPWARKARAAVPPDPKLPKVITRETVTPADALITAGVAHVGTAITSYPRNPKAGGIAFYGEVTIRWESAAPIRAAAGMPLPPEFANRYVLTVEGLPAQMLQAVMPMGSQPFTGTMLKFPNHPPIPAEAVFLLRDRKTLGFVLPQITVDPNERNATFTMICQGLMLKTAFDLQTMRWRGKLEL